MIHIQKYDQERRRKKRARRTNRNRKRKHQLTFQPTSTAASPSPSPRVDSSSETPQVSPSKPGCLSPPNCFWTIQLQHVLTVAYRAHSKTSVLRCSNFLSLKCSSPGSGQWGNTILSFASRRLLRMCLVRARMRMWMMSRGDCSI